MQTTYVKWLRWTLIGGLFLSLIIPFIVSNGQFLPNMFFPFITGKNFAFRILIEILFGVYVLLALREPKYRPRFSPMLIAVVAFVLWGAVAVVFSVDPVKSFWGNFERMEGYITILHLLLYFIVASSVLSAEKLWNWFFRCSIGASVLMSIYGIFQLAGSIPIDQGNTRIDGTLGNAIYLAVYMLFNVFFALLLLYREWDKKTLRWVYAAIILLDTFILFYTETRGTILGLIGGLVVAGLYLAVYTRHNPQWQRLRKFSIGALLVLVVLTAVFIAVRNVPAVQNTPAFGRLATISLSDPETVARLYIWQMAWEGFKEKPIFGWGQENFNFEFNKFYTPVLYGQEQWFDRAHDAFLDWLSNGGLPGFLLFISLFATAVWGLWRARELSIPERAILIGLVAGFAFHEIFVFDNIVSYLQFFTVLALVHGLTQREVPRAVWLSRPLSQQGMAVAVPLVAVVALGGAWFLNAPGISNAEGLVQAIQVQNTTSSTLDLSQNLAEFKAILSGSPLGRQETTEQLLQFTISLGQSQSVSPEDKQNFYTLAYNAITEMTKERPGDARLELFFGSFLDQFGQFQDGLTHLKLALAASPQKQQIMFEMGTNNYLPSGDAKDALSILQQAYSLDTSYDDARIYYAEALYANNEASQADALITADFGTLTPDNTTLLQVYYNTKQFARAATILTNELSSDPTNGQTWLQLASVFYAAGDTKDAITALQKGAQEDPSFAPQADQLIQQLQSTTTAQ